MGEQSRISGNRKAFTAIQYSGLGVSFFALAGISYVMFTSETAWRFLGMAVCIVLGIVALVIGAFAEQDRYKVLKQEPLLFDYEYLKELSHEYGSVKKRYQTIAIPCTIRACENFSVNKVL